MRDLIRPLLLLGVVLLVPIVPFLIFGDQIEAAIAAWLDPPPSPAALAVATVLVLSSDILLPVPSSLVSTVAGARLGFVAATAASWLGMTVGGLLGFWLARTWGHALAVRLARPEDLDRIRHLGDQYGGWIVAITRPLPVLAEAAVLLLGTSQLAWRAMLPPLLLSNLGIAAAYALLGALADAQHALPWAMAASIAVPLVATTIARWWLR